MQLPTLLHSGVAARDENGSSNDVEAEQGDTGERNECRIVGQAGACCSAFAVSPVHSCLTINPRLLFCTGLLVQGAVR